MDQEGARPLQMLTGSFEIPHQRYSWKGTGSVGWGKTKKELDLGCQFMQNAKVFLAFPLVHMESYSWFSVVNNHKMRATSLGNLI